MADVAYIIVKNRDYLSNGPYQWLVQEDVVCGDNIAAFDEREHADRFIAWLNSPHREKE